MTDDKQSFEEQSKKLSVRSISLVPYYAKDQIVKLAKQADKIIADQAKRIAELEGDLDHKNQLLQEHSDKYCDLIYEVKHKYPDESRHETAKRIIHDNQNQNTR